MTRLLVLLLISVISTMALAQSDEALANRFDRMYTSGRLELALKAAEDLLERHPESAWWHFQAGAVCARLDREQDALRHLTICATLNFSGIASFEQNSDLDPLRELEAFDRIVETVRGHAKERMERFQGEAKRRTALTHVPDLNADERRPVIIALHGTGMDGRSMHDALLETAEDNRFILISPDAIRPAGNGFSWTYRDESEWYVRHLIEQAIEAHQGDPERVILIGFSQGANIALIMGQTQPDLFAGVIPICGHYEEQIAGEDATPAPFYLLTGARDPWKRTYALAKKAFEDAGGQVQLRVLASQGHALPRGSREYERAIAWVLDQAVP